MEIAICFRHFLPFDSSPVFISALLLELLFRRGGKQERQTAKKEKEPNHIHSKGKLRLWMQTQGPPYWQGMKDDVCMG